MIDGSVIFAARDDKSFSLVQQSPLKRDRIDLLKELFLNVLVLEFVPCCRFWRPSLSGKGKMKSASKKLLFSGKSSQACPCIVYFVSAHEI